MFENSERTDLSELGEFGLIKHIAEIDQQVEQLLLLRQQLTETLQVWTDTPVKDDQFICPNLKV
jgi:hypothetical protein